MKTIVRSAVLAASLFAASLTALAAGPEVNATSTDLALRGVDPVSYFTDGMPKQGDFGITAVHEGAVYRFATKENKVAFEKEPAKYLPQYGGYCAFAAGLGKKFDGDPNVWKIVDNKLYLNVAPVVAEKWNADLKGNIMKADEMWPKIKSVPFAELQ
jgi:YHS domain-containing protein